MKCKNCGKEYWTRECPCILKPAYSKVKTKGKYSLKAFLITSVTTLLMVGIITIIYDLNRLNNLVVEKDKKIMQLKSSNDYLLEKNTQDSNTITQLSTQNNELRNNNRYTPRATARATTSSNKRYIKPEPEPEYTKQEPIYNNPEIKPKIYNEPKKYTPQKMYHKYSMAKLVSDSRVTVMHDNRLKSNMPIYGRYINKYFTNPICGGSERIYKINNECTAKVGLFEDIYFKKSIANDINKFNRNTHMIECKYNYKNGLMHDCSVKLIGIM